MGYRIIHLNGNLSSNELIDPITGKIKSEYLPSYTKKTEIVCTNEQDTPIGVSWVTQYGDTIVGELEASEDVSDNVYYVSMGTYYDQYMSLLSDDDYVWIKTSTTHDGSFLDFIYVD